jgi:hypothetical protein
LGSKRENNRRGEYIPDQTVYGGRDLKRGEHNEKEYFTRARSYAYRIL